MPSGTLLRNSNGKAAGEEVLSAPGHEHNSDLVVLKRDSDGQLAPRPYQLVRKD